MVAAQGLIDKESHIAGVYAFESSVNFDRYLEELGLSFFMRQMAAVTKPIVTIRADQSCGEVGCFIIHELVMANMGYMFSHVDIFSILSRAQIVMYLMLLK